MIAAIAVVAVVALLAVGRLGELPDADADRAPLALPADRPMDRADVDGVRFAVGLRGYRMDEVDDVLDRLAAEVDKRDARISELESRLAARGVPRPEPIDPGA
jgi:DivIVA domain-containing protein